MIATPEVNSDDLKYIKEIKEDIGSCLVQLVNGYTYACNWEEYCGNPKREKSPCHNIDCRNCAFSKHQNNPEKLHRYLFGSLRENLILLL